MFGREMIDILKSEGLDASGDRLRGAQRAGIFKPPPVKAIVEVWVFRKVNLRQFREYLLKKRPGIQPKHLKTLEEKRETKRTAQARWDNSIDRVEHQAAGVGN